MTTATLDSPLMDAGQVGQILGEDRKTVLAMARSGELGSIRRNSRSVKFAQQHVDEYLAAHEVPAKAAPNTATKPSRNPRYSK